MMHRFHTFLAVAALALTLLPGAARAQQPITVTDVAGRQVTLKQPAKRIVLGEGRQLLAMALIHPDPVSLLAGWPSDLSRQDPVTYGLYRAKFPAIDKIAIVGRGSEDTFSIEQALATNPDLAILSGGYGPSSRSTEAIQRFEAAGIPVVFIDFVAKPLDNTVPSIRLLGRVLGRDQQAEAYIDFYQSRFNRVAKRLADANPPRPTVLMHAHAGLNECCNSPSRATVGAFIDAGGGSNIAVDLLKQRPFGQLSLEYVIERNPQVYIGTGGIHLQDKGGLVLGPGVAPAPSRTFLRELAGKPGISGTDAVKNGRVYGLWHLFANVPVNILAVEVVAKWLHPALFADIDPAASLREINEKFLPVPMQGTYWIGLDPSDKPAPGAAR